jgi:hypothetical protein
MRREHWQMNIDAGKQKYSDKNLPQCNFFPHKHHLGWLGIKSQCL